MKRGSITIYLSLLLVSVLILTSIVAESARINVVHSQIKSYTYMAADSVLAGYARQIYKDYGILLVWEKEALKEQLKKYIQANINMADLSSYGYNFMTTRLQDISINNIEYVNDNGGEELVDQITSYMKYNKLADATDKILNLFNENKQKNKNKYVTKADMVDEKRSDNLKDAVEQITKNIRRLKKEDFSAFDVAGKLTAEQKINYIIKLIKKYLKERKEFQKQENLQISSDYMDENLVVLEQIKDKLEKYELNDSNNKQIKSKLVEEIKAKVESLKIYTPSKQDTKNKDIYESVKELIEKGILSLVIEDVDDISSATVPNSNLPSNLTEEKKNNLQETLKSKAVLTTYVKEKFGSYINVVNGNYLNYEIEYIINGKESDRSNLTDTIEKITAARNIETFAYILTDKGKQAQVKKIALSVSATIGLPFLEPAIKLVLNEGWALAEAISDIKILLRGENIDLIKSKTNWNTDLQNLLNSKAKGSNKKSALNYSQICQMLILSLNVNKVIYRVMDLIQLNIQKKYNPDFEINECFQSFEFCAEYQTEPLFSAMPWVLGLLGEKVGVYNTRIKCQNKY